MNSDIPYFDILEQAHDIVMVTEAAPAINPGPKIVYVNQAFERITGYNRIEAVGQTPRILQGPKTDRGALDQIHKALIRLQPTYSITLNQALNIG